MLALLVTTLLGAAAAPSPVWPADAVAALEDAVAEGRYQTVTSALISKNGEILYEGYFQGADADTRHDTRSATKTVTSFLVGAAIADGRLTGVDQTIAPFFDDKRPFAHDGARKDAITIEDLLTMSGPLECDDWNQFSRGNEERMYVVEDWTSFFLDLEFRGFPPWTTPPSQSAHGRAFSYCTAGVHLLGQLVQRAVGEDLEAYAQRRLFDAVGTNGVVWPRNGAGEAVAAGGLRLTTRELARLAELQLSGVGVEDAEVLPPSWRESATTPRARIDDDTEYGYLWWLRTYEVGGESHPVVYMAGNGGNRVWVLPDHGVVVVLTKTDYNSAEMHDAADAFFDEQIVARLTTAE